MRNATTIMIPFERHHQLKALAAVFDLSIPETVARLIRVEVAKNTIPADLVGVRIEKTEAGIVIAIDDNAPTTFNRAAAHDLADTIMRAVNGEPLHKLDLDADFSVERRGNGVKVSVPFVGEARSFSKDVAADLAALIGKAAE